MNLHDNKGEMIKVDGEEKHEIQNTITWTGDKLEHIKATVNQETGTFGFY
jgi:hypothetical protein